MSKTILRKIPDEDVYYNFEDEIEVDETRFIIYGNDHFRSIGNDKLLSIVDGTYDDDEVGYDYETLEELKEDIKKKVAERKEADAETGLQTQLIEAMLEGFEAEIPNAMIETKIKNRMNIDYANLIRATVNSAIAGTIYNEYVDEYQENDGTFNYGDKTGVRAINLLGKYKDEGYGIELTPQTAMKDLDFLKYCAYQIMLYSDRMQDMSTLFNVGKRERFTPKDLQHIVLLSEFARGADVYLQSDTFHNELTRLPKHETVNYWQGTGDDYAFGSTSKIHITTNVTEDGNEFQEQEVQVTGVIGVIFDHDMLGVNNERNKVTSHYNGKGDFVNYFYKSFARYFNDFDENCVVFFVA